MLTLMGQPEKMQGRSKPGRIWLGLSTQNGEIKQQHFGVLHTSWPFKDRGLGWSMSFWLMLRALPLKHLASGAGPSPLLSACIGVCLLGSGGTPVSCFGGEGVEALSVVLYLCHWVLLCLQAPAVWQWPRARLPLWGKAGGSPAHAPWLGDGQQVLRGAF